MSISNRIGYMHSLYLIEMSISNRITLFTKSLHLTEKSISNRKVYTKSLYEKSIRKVYL